MATALLLLLVAPAAFARDGAVRPPIIHVLDRLAFGPSAADVRYVEQVGIDRYIAEQLDPAAIADPPELTERLASLTTLRMKPSELLAREAAVRAANPNPNASTLTVEERKARRRELMATVREASEARVWRALYSRRQLNEVMVDFWFNHFNVYSGKSLDRVLIGAYEEQAIRPHALGKFRDLLLATARHPAMLVYLDVDNRQNGPPGKNPNGKEFPLNENYAREVLELHTLGADGGYTQDDVVALARILTGWGFAAKEGVSADGTGFVFRKQRHDFGAKRLLGRDFEPSGEAEGVEALTMLARSPATARRIGFKLAQYFVADQPPPALVDRLAARFLETDGDIRAVLQALLTSEEFRDSAGGKYKTPYRYVLSAVRAAGVAVSNPEPLLRQLTELGMPLYGCQTPDGYSDTADKWLSADAGPKRVNFALALARGSLRLDASDAATAAGPAGRPVDEAAVLTLLEPALSAKTRAAIAAAPAGQRAALVLGSPDFMRR